MYPKLLSNSSLVSDFSKIDNPFNKSINKSLFGSSPANKRFNNLEIFTKISKTPGWDNFSSLFVLAVFVIRQKSFPFTKSIFRYEKSCKTKRNFEDIFRTP